MKYLKSKKLLAIVIILLAIASEFLIVFLFHSQENNCENLLENLYYSSQIVSSTFVISGVVIAVWQYYLSCKSAKNNLEITQVQRAIDLSEYYKNNILNLFPAIKYVFDQVGISEIFENISPDQMNDFDIYELKKLISPKNIEKLKNIQNTNTFTKAILEANDIYGLKLQFISVETFSEASGKHAKILHVEKNSLVIAFMANLLNATLNNLEFFALHFKHKTADESVIYQSIHQTYLETIPYLYYYISNQNTNPSNKLYTNAIWLFLEWRTKKQQQDTERSQKALSVQSHGTIIE